MCSASAPAVRRAVLEFVPRRSEAEHAEMRCKARPFRHRLRTGATMTGREAQRPGRSRLPRRAGRNDPPATACAGARGHAGAHALPAHPSATTALPTPTNEGKRLTRQGIETCPGPGSVVGSHACTIDETAAPSAPLIVQRKTLEYTKEPTAQPTNRGEHATIGPSTRCARMQALPRSQRVVRWGLAKNARVDHLIGEA
jgi:hypothetical protein